MKYRITWTIDRAASSPREAAHFAREIQEQTQNTATVFLVQEHPGDVGILVNVGDEEVSEADTNYSCYVNPLQPL